MSLAESVKNGWPRSLLGLLLLLLAGCAGPGFAPPAGTTLSSLGRTDPTTPPAWSPDAKRLALAKDGLVLLTLTEGKRRTIAATSPAALAWAPDGDLLVAAFGDGDGEGSLLRIYRGDRTEAEVKLKGQVESLFWTSEGEVLAVANRITRYSFGANFAAYLYRWDTEAGLREIRLFDATLQPRTLNYFGDHLGSAIQARLSPYGDELLYCRLLDPPVFIPYKRVFLYHLETGGVRQVGEVSFTASGGRYLGRGDDLLIADGDRQTVRLDPWRGTDLAVWPWPGDTLAASAEGDLLLIDGHLLRKGEEILTLPAGIEGWFSPAGDQLLLRREGNLFLLSGLEPENRETRPAPPADLLLWRNWRSRGLITHEEYLGLAGEAAE